MPFLEPKLRPFTWVMAIALAPWGACMPDEDDDEIDIAEPNPSESEGSGQGGITAAQPDAVNSAISISSSGAIGTLMDFAVPPDSGQGAPNAYVSRPNVQVEQGGSVSFPLPYDSPDGIQTIFASAVAANTHFEIPVNASLTSGTFDIAVGVSGSIATGQVCLDLAVSSLGGWVSAHGMVCMDVLSPGSLAGGAPATGGMNGEVCSGENAIPGCAMEFCATWTAGACTNAYYRVNGAQYPCYACQDVTACAQEAANACLATQ